MAIKIVITDDHPLVLSGLRAILEESDDIEVTATCNNGDELMAGLRSCGPPDVVLVDLHMPGRLQGRALIWDLKSEYPHLPVLVLSSQESLYQIKEIMEAGSNGYLLKNSTDLAMLTRAVKTVYNGELFLETPLKDELLRNILKRRKENDHSKESLTRRQIEIIQLLSEGFSSSQIAEQLYLSVRTVESHRQRLMQKMNTTNVTGLLKKAAELGVVK